MLGLDGSPAMVEAARAAAKVGGARFEVGRVEDVGALSQSFDGAICLSVLEYLPEPERALKAIAGRLKPGGRLALSAPNRGLDAARGATPAAAVRRRGRLQGARLSRQLPASVDPGGA